MPEPIIDSELPVPPEPSTGPAPQPTQQPLLEDDDDDGAPPVRFGGGISELRPWLLVVAGGALLGLLFAAFSTSDFVKHLDRQIHSIHCSVVPGAGLEIGESGCRAALMSPYSSLFRQSLWGGIPIALLALAVFAYLMFCAIEFALRPKLSKTDTRYLVAAALLPVVTSVFYGIVSIVAVGEFCDNCVGIYFSSALALFGAVVAHVKARRADQPGLWHNAYALWFGEGVAYVAVLTFIYFLLAPLNDKSVRGCGTLVRSDDPNQVMFALGGVARGAPAITVIDPLCSACTGFEARIRSSGLLDRINMRGVLMPLDSTCNWMVKESLHPGACAVSEAILCDRDRGAEIMDYALAHRNELIDLAKSDEKKLRQRLVEQFPAIKGCLGTPGIKNKVNKSLRWTVANALPVLTPQLFIGDRRLCDEDTDLGLEYTMAAMLAAGPGAAGRR
ncbi:MAG: hypothetical protein JXR83_15450 [Deltaproteobacteria bacterium]|nr:hypothetical protein [Deltaproteobacteria bacterium]